MGGKGEGVYAHGYDHPKEEVKMPDSIDVTGRSEANGKECRTEGKEHAGDKTIDEVSRHHDEESGHHFYLLIQQDLHAYCCPIPHKPFYQALLIYLATPHK